MILMFDAKVVPASKGLVGKVRSIERSVVQNADGFLQRLVESANDAVKRLAFVSVPAEEGFQSQFNRRE